MKYFYWFKSCHYSFRGLIRQYAFAIVLLFKLLFDNPIKFELEWLNQLCVALLVVYAFILSGLILKNKTNFKSNHIRMVFRVFFAIWSVILGLFVILMTPLFWEFEQEGKLMNVYGRSSKVYEIHETRSVGKTGP